MIELIIDNSVSRLNNLPIAHHRALKRLLSYKDTSKRLQKIVKDKLGRPVLSKLGKPKIVTVYATVPLLSKDGKFPTGLLYIVEGYLVKNVEHFNRKDNRVPPKLHSTSLGKKFKLPPNIKAPYREQVDAAKAVAKYKRGVISAPTGLGKSLICALIVKELGLSTLIVVPSLELKKQLTEDLQVIFGKESAGPLLKGKKAFDITVENVDQLDYNKPAVGFDCVIIDEFHHSGAKTYRKLNEKAWGKIYYRVGLTATPFRSRDEERILLESVLSRTIYKIDYNTAVLNGYILPLEFYYIDLPKIKVDGKTWQTVYKELVVNREDRNNIISSFMSNAHEQGLSALVIIKEVEHGHILHKKYPKATFVHGKNADSAKLIKLFSSGELTPLIGSPIIGEGVNTRACEYVFMADMTKSKNLFMQRAGRAVRVFGQKGSGKIILVRDSSHKWLLNHFNECVKFIKEEYGVEPQKLDLL